MKAASDREITSLEKHAVYELVPITAVPAGQRVVCTRCISNEQLLNKLKTQLMDRFEITDMADMLRVLGMNVIRDREKGTITNDLTGYKDIVERFDMKDCNPAFSRGG